MVITIKTKTCSSCGLIKSIDLFCKHKLCSDGYTGYCKECKSQVDKDYIAKYSQTKEFKNTVNTKNRRCRHKYRDEWREFFIEKYGLYPLCEICKKTLSWTTGDRKLSPCFDHRQDGKEIIQSTPASWYTCGPCTSQRIQIWESCNFGLLCITCNIGLPTQNRQEWLLQVTKYING